MYQRQIWGVTFPFNDNPHAGVEMCDRGPRTNFTSPLTINWCLGSDVVGDFTHPLVGPIFVKKTVGQNLIRNFSELSLAEVKFIKAQHLIKPKEIKRKLEPRVWWPYTGEEIFELKCQDTLVIDMLRTTAPGGEDVAQETVYVSGCAAIKTFPGGDETAMISRKEHEGVYVKSSAVIDFFRLKSPLGFELMCCAEPDWEDGQYFDMFCSARGKNFIESQKYTNVCFLEVGEFF
jgi:hypothetical protein